MKLCDFIYWGLFNEPNCHWEPNQIIYWGELLLLVFTLVWFSAYMKESIIS